jgi:hypothetical protein
MFTLYNSVSALIFLGLIIIEVKEHTPKSEAIDYNNSKFSRKVNKSDQEFIN